MKTWGLAVILVMLAGVAGGADNERPKTKEPEAKAQTKPEAKAEAAAPPLALDLGGGVTMELVLIPAGKFVMGSPANEAQRDNDEGPQHEVTITRPFYVGKYEVTQAQYEAVMGNNPSYFKEGADAPRRPVERVSWDDAQAFCQKLSQRTGKAVRLPTEAEWEYACRAGTTTRFNFGDEDGDLFRHANYCDKSNTNGLSWQDKAHDDGHDKTAPAGSFQPNAWGLYDMHGNVWEWCQDWYGPYAEGAVRDPTGAAQGSARVLRGGSWFDDPWLCRSARRYGDDPVIRCNDFGFRVLVPARTP